MAGGRRRQLSGCRRRARASPPDPASAAPQAADTIRRLNYPRRSWALVAGQAANGRLAARIRLGLGVGEVDVAPAAIVAGGLAVLLQRHELARMAERPAAAVAADMHGVGQHHLAVVHQQEVLDRHPPLRSVPSTRSSLPCAPPRRNARDRDEPATTLPERQL